VLFLSLVAGGGIVFKLCMQTDYIVLSVRLTNHESASFPYRHLITAVCNLYSTSMLLEPCRRSIGEYKHVTQNVLSCGQTNITLAINSVCDECGGVWLTTAVGSALYTIIYLPLERAFARHLLQFSCLFRSLTV